MRIKCASTPARFLFAEPPPVTTVVTVDTKITVLPCRRARNAHTMKARGGVVGKPTGTNFKR